MVERILQNFIGAGEGQQYDEIVKNVNITNDKYPIHDEQAEQITSDDVNKTDNIAEVVNNDDASNVLKQNNLNKNAKMQLKIIVKSEEQNVSEDRIALDGRGVGYERLKVIFRDNIIMENTTARVVGEQLIKIKLLP